LPAPRVTFPSGEDASTKLMVYGEGHRTKSGRGFSSDFTPQRTIAFNDMSPALGSGEEQEETHPWNETHYNPFESCFVVLNPAREKKQEDSYVDPHWKEMNSTESCSLLKCKKNYTL